MLLPTVGTETIDLHLVILDQETVTCGDIFLQLFNGFILEFDDGVAASANQVIVVFPGQGMFIAGLTVIQQDLACQASLCKQLEGTIYSRMSDAGIAGFDFEV